MVANELRNSNLLHLEDVYQAYGDHVVLDDIDLSVAHGELVTVVGPSGAGKSTLLRLILGQELPSSGEILVSGEPVGFADPSRGIVYQKYSLFPNMSVLDNVTLGKRLELSFFQWQKRKIAIIDEAMHYLEKVGLNSHSKKYPHELSGGMRQRVAVVQALIKRPKILMMDEPFGALDPGTREDLQIFLLELWEETDMTIFFVTHDLEEAAYLGSRLIVLSQHYSDDRGDGPGVQRGAKIVADHILSRSNLSTDVKYTKGFGKLIARIRREGFDPQHRQHIREFDLKHPHSFRTNTVEEVRCK